MLENLRLSEKALNEKLLVRRPGDFEYDVVRDIQKLRMFVLQLHSRCVELEGALATLTDSPTSATLETVTLVAPERVYADALRTLKRPPMILPTLLLRWLMRHLGIPELGTRMKKKRGSAWHGSVVGFYMSSISPFGAVIESEREAGSCQIYPLHALEKVDE